MPILTASRLNSLPQHTSSHCRLARPPTRGHRTDVVAGNLLHFLHRPKRRVTSRHPRPRPPSRAVGGFPLEGPAVAHSATAGVSGTARARGKPGTVGHGKVCNPYVPR